MPADLKPEPSEDARVFMNKLLSMSIRTQILLLAFIVAIPAMGIIIYSGIHMREEAIV